MNGEIILWGILVVSAIIMLIYYGKSDAPIRSSLKGVFFGAAALAAVHFLGAYFSFTLPLNIFNIAVSLILGVPGVILLVLGKIFLCA